MRVLGVDLFSGSLDSRTQPRYSMVFLEDGAVITRDEVNRRRLLRAIRELRPDRVACDNVYELFKKNKERSFYYLMPHNTKVVQVNGPPGAQRPLHIVAKEHGVKLSPRASSIEEAEACAILAAMNVGCYAEIFTCDSVITVTRARSPGKGGQSQNRFRRRVHERVGQKIREIEAQLKEDGIPFSLSLVRADFGYSRGEFHVRAPINVLGKVRRTRGTDVQVKKLPVERKKMEFLPISIQEKAVIVGIDPGTTTGVAVIDLEGRLCEVLSGKDFSLKNVLSFLVKYPQVLVVASDVSPAPRLVEKVSSSLSSLLYTPTSNLTVAEKKALVDSKFTRDGYSNSHERDAIAAALKAYNHFKPKLENFDKRLKKKDLSELSGDVKSLALKGISLERAVKKLTKKDDEAEKKPKKKVSRPKGPGIIKTLREEIRILKKERDDLRTALKDLKERVASLEKQLEKDESSARRKLLRDAEIRKKNKEIATLRSLLRDERKLRMALKKELSSMQKRLILEPTENLVLIKIIQKFTRDGIAQERKKIKKGDVIFLPDPVGGGKAAAEKLMFFEPRAVIVDAEKLSEPAMDVLRKITIISPARVKMKLVDGFALADKKSLEAEINKVAEKMKLERAVEKRRWLETYLRKYREERKKK